MRIVIDADACPKAVKKYLLGTGKKIWINSNYGN